MFQYVLFGAGKDGKRALREIGKNRITFFIDNHVDGEVEGIPVYCLEKAVQKINENTLILITSGRYKDEMAAQLRGQGINEYLIYTFDNGMNIDSNNRLTEQGWAELYNEDRINSVLKHLVSNEYNPWTIEMLKLTKPGESVLEIGCGSGETSLALAKAGRKVSALDFSGSSIELVKEVLKKYGSEIDVQTYCMDARGELPFLDQQFDCVFHAGLLEHFYQDERINMLKKWKRICRKMVCMVPNACCIPYRIWKEELEKENRWPYGIEMPQKTLYEDFEKAGYEQIREYTIGFEYILQNFPKEHYVRKTFESIMDSGFQTDDWGQGYLLVTIGLANTERII